MRILPVVKPTSEQLQLLLDTKPGVFVIKGAAGSGKTTTALMRLRHLCAWWLKRRERLGLARPVRVLVLTYNRTLQGYIAELAAGQVQSDSNLQLEVTTFGKLAVDLVGRPDANATDNLRQRLVEQFGMPEDFLDDEIQYVLGRFEPARLEEYITAQRDGRGVSPRMEAGTRRRLLDEVIYPYIREKEADGLRDWNDVAIEAGDTLAEPWDVVIVDEAQDFSANQVRAILKHVPDDHSVTFVLDAAQRIYPRSFTWKEAGIPQVTSRTLKKNHRNTQQIAALARSLVNGMTVGDDGVLPDFDAATETGPLPNMLVGKFSDQMDWVSKHVLNTADLVDESVAFLHPRGGGWFDYVKARLRTAGIAHVELTRASEWPGGTETVALCTIHSAKGLEFDHVVVLGLNQEVTPHGDGADDAALDNLRRLLAMGVGRARKTVTIGYKSEEASTLIKLIDPSTYQRIDL
jgi:superfamily I DNA/RNA helicase